MINQAKTPLRKSMMLAAAALAVSVAGSAIAQPGGYFGNEAPRSFWYGAPNNIHDRIDFLDHRIARLRDDRRISPGEWSVFQRDLSDIHARFDYYMNQDRGQLSRGHSDLLWHKLQEVSHRLNWRSEYGY